MTRQQFELTQLPGLSMADILLLPEAQRQMISWLLQHGTVTIAELIAGLEQPEAEVALILEDLVRRGAVEEITIGEEPHFRPRLIEAEGGLPLLEPGKPIAVILNSTGGDRITPGSIFELGVTIRNKGNQSALIDVFMDDLPPMLRQWCQSSQERLALGAKQSGEVIFRFNVPVDALPGAYEYIVVVDAPQHYPEHTPIHYLQQLQVLPPIHDAVRVSDPTFMLEPGSSSTKSLPVRPGEILQFQALVHNRSERVDRFRFSCTDLPEGWYTFRYPMELQGQGLAREANCLNLNPGGQGIVSLLLHPPIDALAGSYVPTLRLHSENNPSLALLDLIYFQVQPVHQLHAELRTLVSRVGGKAGLFAIQLSNRGNTERNVQLNVVQLDGGELCDYRFDLDQVKLLPKQTLTSRLEVKPNDRWKRPIWGGGRLLNFSVELEDAQRLPLPPVPMNGFILWQARPWWQILPFVLAGIGGLLLLVWLIWWLLFRPPVSPKVIHLFPENTSYAAEDGDFVHLGFEISEVDRLQAIEVVGQGADGKVLSSPIIYDFSQGIPSALRPFCLQQRQQLTCRNVRTDARLPATYIFKLSLIPRPGRGVQPDSALSVPVTVNPIPLPEITEFTSTQPIYQQAPPPRSPQTISLTTSNSSPSSSFSSSSSSSSQSSQSSTTPSTAAPTPLSGTQPIDKPVPPVPNAHQVHLNWTIAHPKQVEAIQLVGHDAEGTIVTPITLYKVSRGLPKELQGNCELKEQLICRNVKTGIAQVGDYTFELTVIPKGEAPAEPILRKTDVIKIEPRPPQIYSFKINGSEAMPKYILPIVPGQAAPNLIFSWDVENDPGSKVELLPAPGTVPAMGVIPFPLAPEPGSIVVTLQVTNASGQQVSRAITIETFAQPGAGGASPATVPVPTPPAAAGEVAQPKLDAPVPTDPNRLSPTELPPQFN